MVIRVRSLLELEEEYNLSTLDGESLYVPRNDHHVLINTRKGIYLFSTLDLAGEPTRIINDGKMTR